MSTLAQNKRARFEYEVLDTFEAGMVLEGWEVKSLRGGKASLTECFVALRDGEAIVLNMHINKWPGMHSLKAKPETQERKLLLSRDELSRLQKGTAIKGNTIVPLDVHTAGKRIKMKLALVRGKKLYDKREAIKKRDLEREIKRDLL